MDYYMKNFCLLLECSVFTAKFFKENVLWEWWIFRKNLAITWQCPLAPKADHSPVKKGAFLPKNSLTIVPKNRGNWGYGENLYILRCKCSSDDKPSRKLLIWFFNSELGAVHLEQITWNIHIRITQENHKNNNYFWTVKLVRQ